jgi:hypothetical protein
MTSSEEENKNFKGKDPMSPEKIISHEPTAVKRDPQDQKIAKGGKTGTDSAEAKEKYRKELAKQNIEGTIFIFTILTHMELTLIQ